ncbi:MAG TPA: bifunctional serine/threonine-protein kinase/universal stress protein, partial [Candidatus Methanoperedens sp.]|nr:bifunctional serine/threonine-protein kinase/universal stress protein [Candidatus Methanoperedens sp.]
FETELILLPRLGGVHVPRLIAAADFDAQPYLAMEFIPGPTLEERLAAAPLGATTVADIGARLADALHELHRQEVIHLDLSPDNVMFHPDGEAVLLDFGLARHRRLPDLLGEAFRRPLGTAAWMAPEQVLGVRDDFRSDLFALGAILYALLTGRTPFGEPESPRGLRRRLTREPLAPRAIAEGCPPWLQEIVLRCLEVDPARRHENAAQLAFDLRNPDQVSLTERATRLGVRGLIDRAAHRLGGTLAALAPRSAPRFASRGRRALQVPIVMAAVDVAQGSEALAEALRLAALGALELDAEARLTCVTVHRLVPGSRLNVAEGGRAVHVQRLVELKEWARTLDLPPRRVSFHVLDAADPAAALIDFARTNHVDYIVIGARGSSALRRHLGSVSARVAAEAPCTVTVVRAPHAGEPAGPLIMPETREGGL